MAAGDILDELCAELGVMTNMGVKELLAGTAIRKSYVSALSKFAPNQALLRTIYTFAAQQSMLRCAPKQQMVRSKVVRQRLRGLKVMEDITLSTLGSLYLAVTSRIGNMVK